MSDQTTSELLKPAREPFWSQKAIEAARPLIGAARAATPEQSTGDAA